MGGCKRETRSITPWSSWLLVVVLGNSPGYADPAGAAGPAGLQVRDEVVVSVGPAGGESGGDGLRMIEGVVDRARQTSEWLLAWYRRTPPLERATWGGLTACACLGLVVLLERVGRLRKRRIVPAEFTARFL